ncbi:MAG: SoxR reducing system RseC family protein [Gammaproteobacteria bacterium]|nr:SoxR reducing system RseC family protein [Gammaproteobacteria bacterium]MDH5239460.1 SoxR reducing system RseC family protein [Gammaproteobacteria bacterium]MDH5260403.1 SoxR reducing system RseC family protein [Gammaproteobacteria bacterium]MDH5583153.1 SoxR reducing system RseC family protein [Gammaproteobacteria bacterium]
MQNPEGKVVSVSDDALGTVAIVEVTAEIACERCRSGKGCGAGLLGRQAAEKQVKARVAFDLDIHRGDRVTVSLEPQHLLRAAGIVYGYPLLGGLLAAVIALFLGLGDVMAALVALTGLLAGIGFARIHVQNNRCLKQFTPVVVSRLSRVSD